MGSRVKLMPARGQAAPTPLAERGRMLFVRDVQALFGQDEKGRWRKSDWWIRNRFAPESKRHLGRDPYWWEMDAVRWMDDQRDESAA